VIDVGTHHATLKGGPAPRDGSIRAVVRALKLLRIMNGRQIWVMRDLHTATGLPKATLWRLLATLIDEGYVRADEPAGTYRLTVKIRELDAGYTEHARLIDAGRPTLLKVTKRIKWPLALGKFDQDAMVVQFSTMPYSPLAVTTTTLGHRLSLFESAMGRAYLAFCSPVERASMLQLLAGEGAMLQRVSLDTQRVRQDGFAVRHPELTHGSATLAVPVLYQQTAIAALSMTTFGRSMTRTTIDRHVPVLMETARTVAAAAAAGELEQGGGEGEAASVPPGGISLP